jgi:lysophospholipase L1-like esterase
MLLEKGQKLLFIGDSVTDCERLKPDGEGLFRALGNGYVSFIDGWIRAVYPELAIRVVNKGISGNTVRDLKERWQKDVLDQNADWLSIMIGINDVWRQYDSPFIKDTHVYIDEYESTLTQLVSSTKPQVANIVLMTPFYIENNDNDQMRRTMDQYGDVVKKIANENNCILVDTQAAFNKVLHHLYPASLAWDRVHPDTAGHMILAKEFLNCIGFDWKKSL